MRNFTPLLTVEILRGNPLITTFGEKMSVEMKSTEELVGWIIFGDTKQKSFLSQLDNKNIF